MQTVSSIAVGVVSPKLVVSQARTLRMEQPNNANKKSQPSNEDESTILESKANSPSTSMPLLVSAPLQQLQQQVVGFQQNNKPTGLPTATRLHSREHPLTFDKAPTPIILGSTPADHTGARYVFLVDDSRSSVVPKNVTLSHPGRLGELVGKQENGYIEKMEESVQARDNDDDGDFSDGGSEASLDDVREHHGMIKSSKSDDQDRLILFEAHVSRLDEVGNTAAERYMAATAQQSYVTQQGFEQNDVQVQNSSRSSSNVSQTEFSQAATTLPHGITVVTTTLAPASGQHSGLSQATLAVQAPQLQQAASIQPGSAQIITASVISAEDLASAAISKEGFTTSEVQYVEATADHSLYSNGGSGSNAYHYNDNSMYTQQASATAYMDAAAQPQQAQTFTGAAASVVQWLLENYETAEGVSLPRSTLYNHYLTHCQTHKLDPVNAASFGKLIRSVFLGLRTRRLGTRGNSKYHYYGIRIKPSSPLNALTDDAQVALRQSPSTQKRLKPASRVDGVEGVDGYPSQGGTNVDSAQQSQHQQHQQYLGDITQGLPDFEDLDPKGTPLPEGVLEEDLDTFQDMYREHCEAFLDVVVNLQFALVESLWQSFWRHPSTTDVKREEPSTPTSGIKELGDDEDNEKRLPKVKLAILCEYEPVVAYVKSCDHLLYQTLVEVLIPDVLRPIPSSLTQAIRNFAKGLEGWLAGSLSSVPKKMADVKVSSCCAFAQTLRRYTSLNHLAQAARAVLQNTSQITQMLNDLNRVDFANVQEQAAWVCQCDDHMVYRFEQDFKLTLQQQNSLEQWATWLEGVVDQFLKPHEGSENYPKAARQFLLKWSFYSSMIIRDLTLRSAASFGSFHLIRLLYDEYMFYLVEHKVAKAVGASPVAVMGEYVGLGAALAMGLDAVESTLISEQNGSETTVATTKAGASAVSSLGEPEVKRVRQS
ncbi:DNA-binding protein RFX2 isoform X2 [Nematostella vectensis]|uniref:DNA-binding protein RFX2 isoform X2 n=1 Tax=Nematostella vectensis TaxID=45351 RepID=UPI0020777F1D|nr:DNA-binding protein RFX2 isoform X2 [Nematostella vectensis]